jgi:hypothetical protein
MDFTTMTAITFVPGMRIRNWEVLSVDPTGKRITCRCRCGAIRVVALTALESGACTSCGCRPLTLAQRSELRAEQARRALDEWHT